MDKIKLTPEQQRLFDRNFDRKAYEDAKELILKAIRESKSCFDLWDKLRPYDRDTEYADDCTIIWCEVELDRSRMETDGDYVGLTFYINWYDEADAGLISHVELYSTETSREYIADRLCCFDPDTCEITEWFYEGKNNPNIDDKQ